MRKFCLLQGGLRDFDVGERWEYKPMTGGSYLSQYLLGGVSTESGDNNNKGDIVLVVA